MQYQFSELRHRKVETSHTDEVKPESPSIVSYGKLEGRRAVKLGIASAIGCCIALLGVDALIAWSSGGVSIDVAAKGILADLVLSAEAGLVSTLTYSITATSTAVSALAMKVLTCCLGPGISRETAHKAIVAFALPVTAGLYGFFVRAVFSAFVSGSEALAFTALSFAVSAIAYRHLSRSPAGPAQDIHQDIV